MKIWFANQWLATGEDSFASGLNVSLHQQVQTARYLRSAKALPIARGNRLHAISFTLATQESTFASAMETSISRLSALPESGLLQIYRNEGVIQANPAVLESARTETIRNQSTFWNLTFQASSIETLDPDNLYENKLMSRYDQTDLATGTDEGAVTFAALPTTPLTIIATVQKPSDSAPDIGVLATYNRSTTGFSYRLTASPQQSGYKLDYLAIT